MFFILSKVLFFLLVPFWWIIFLLIWMRFTKSAVAKKRIGIATVAIVIIFTNPWIHRTLVLKWQPEPAVLPAGKTYEAGIILGGLSGYDQNRVGHFGDNADRFIQTANLYHKGIIKRIIVSGGSGLLDTDVPPEAPFLRQAFIENGIPDSVIIIESKSRNTYENGLYSKELIDSLHIHPPFILITSAMHMPRSVSVYRKAKIDILPFPCDYKTSSEENVFMNVVVPSPSLLFQWTDFLKEVVGLNVYRLTGKA